MTRLVGDYIRNRTAILSVQGKEYAKTTNRGCPQGSILGPTLWNICLNSILRRNIRNTTMLAYADDMLLIIKANNLAKLQTNTQASTDALKTLLGDINLKVSAAKTNLMVIRRKTPATFHVQIDDATIKPVQELTHLGLHVTRNFKWAPHLKAQQSNLTKLIHQLRRLRHNGRGIYELDIIPKLLYSSPVWTEGLRHKVNTTVLDTIQHIILLAITRAFSRTPLRSLRLITNSEPLQYTALRHPDTYRFSKHLETLVPRTHVPCNGYWDVYYSHQTHPTLNINILRRGVPFSPDAHVATSINLKTSSTDYVTNIASYCK